MFVDARFEPLVVRPDLDETSLLVTVSDASVTRLAVRAFREFQQNGVSLDSLILLDDGEGADATAGDRVFTSRPFTVQRFDNHKVSSYNLNLIGRVNINRGNEPAEQVRLVYSLPLGLLDAEFRIITPRRGSPEAGIDRTDHVVAFIEDRRGLIDDLPVLRRALSLSSAEPDFLAIASLNSRPFTPPVRFFGVKSEALGIGTDPFDSSSGFGSSGTLKAFLDIQGLPDFCLLNRGSSFQWITRLDDSLHLNPGTWGAIERPSSIRRCESSSSFFDRGPYATLSDQGAGSYLGDYGSVRVGFNDLDLYFMGLVTPEDVDQPIRALVSPVYGGIDRQGQTREISADGVAEITIADIVAVHGPRLPAAGDAQTAFTLQTFVVYDRPLTDIELTFLDVVMRGYETVTEGFDAPSFEQATGGRATMTTRIFSTGVSTADGPAGAPRLTLAGANPVHDIARFRLADTPAGATLEILDVLGRRVATLPVGRSVTWDVTGVAPGVYSAVLRHASGVESLRLSVVR